MGEEWPDICTSFFAGEFLSLTPLLHTVAAFVAFSLAASAGYALNDVREAEQDAAHPTKRARPVASGRVSKLRALTVGLMLVLGSLVVASFVSGLLAWAVEYMVLTVLYTLALKRVPVLEFVVVALT